MSRLGRERGRPRGEGRRLVVLRPRPDCCRGDVLLSFRQLEVRTEEGGQIMNIISIIQRKRLLLRD